MATITATNTLRESLGSLTLLMVSLVTQSQSDIYNIQANSPVVSWWAETNNGNGTNDPDITWTPSTGNFLLTNGTASSGGGALTLFILMRT